MARHAAGNGMDRELDVNTCFLQQLHEVVQLVLRLRDRQTVAWRDDDLAGVAHVDTGIARIDRLHAAGDLALLFIAGRRSEEHTSELQSLMRISYAVFCLKNKRPQEQETNTHAYLHSK